MRRTVVPLASVGMAGVLRTGVAEQPGGTPSGEWGSGGMTLLVRDATTAVLLIDDARRRLVARALGLPLDQTGLVTLIAIGAVADAVYKRTVRVLSAPGPPPAGDTALAVGLVREAAHIIAGDLSRDNPLLLPLVAFAVSGALVRPVVRVALGQVRASSHRARVGFDHRYGHLVRRNRPHEPLPQ